MQAVSNPAVRLGRAERVNLMQAFGLPETVILDYLTGLEAASILAPGGPRDLDEALIHASRQLVAIPLTATGGGDVSRAATSVEATAGATEPNLRRPWPTARSDAQAPTVPSGSELIRLACLSDDSSPVAKYPVLLQALLGRRFVVQNYSVAGATMLLKGDRPFLGTTGSTRPRSAPCRTLS